MAHALTSRSTLELPSPVDLNPCRSAGLSAPAAVEEEAKEPEPLPEREPEPEVAPEPDAEFNGNCDALLRDFLEDECRFVLGGKVENTGNIAAVAEITGVREHAGVQALQGVADRPGRGRDQA